MYFEHPDLVPLLEAGATVLTPSRFLASAIRRQFGQAQVDRQRTTWAQADVLSVTAWLERQWHLRSSQNEDLLLLNGAQELWLWRSSIEQSGRLLVDVWAAARAARTTAALASAWNISPAHEGWNEHGDGSAFRQWWRQVGDQCCANRWVTAAGLWSIVPPLLPDGEGKTIAFAGFADETAALRSLFAALTQRNCKVQKIASERQSNHEAAVFYSTPELEYEHAARWARQKLEYSGVRSIGIVIPGLRTKRVEVARAFKEIFRPQSVIDPAKHDARDTVLNFHLTSGPILSETPLGVHALACLDLGRRFIPVNSASLVLRSPFIHNAEQEASVRTFADLRLRRFRSFDVSFGDIEKASAACPDLLSVMRRVKKRLPAYDSILALSHWSSIMAQTLRDLKWPEGRTALTQSEQNSVEAWNEVLSQLASLSLVSGPVKYDAALALLRQLAAQPSIGDGNDEAKVQIVDAIEAAEVRFDAAWVCGLSDDVWPPREAATAMLPVSLRREHNMPAADRSSQHARVEQLSDRILSCGRTVVGSYSKQDEDSNATMHSLAAKWFANPVDSIFGWDGRTQRATELKLASETLQDNRAPAFRVSEKFKGGTGVIKAQSACPFQAFAKYRLVSDQPNSGVFGYDARDRGSNVHRALEHFWAAVKTQQNLIALSPEALDEAVDAALDLALRGRSEEPEFNTGVRGAERVRLRLLVLEWLAQEQRRIEPFAIEATEVARQFQVGDLSLSLRLDRIDRLQNGGYVLIDYKTGKQNIESLSGDRPDEPQLLLYATAMQDNVEGLYFAQTRRGEMDWKGFGRRRFVDGGNAGVEDWPQLLEEWRSIVQELGNNFTEGHAPVAPKDVMKTCRFCELHSICRINSARETSE